LEPPTATLWTLYFIAQHYDHLEDADMALEYIDRAIEHTPTLIEAYMIRAMIFKVKHKWSKAFFLFFLIYLSPFQKLQ
jgi:peptide alpha-N-acetyltransferase